VYLRSLSCAVALILATASPRAQSADEVLRRVGDWVHSFVQQFANVVGEEEYVPTTSLYTRSRLRSEYLLVQYPGSDGRWLTFRDVVAVDGHSLGNQPERLAKLFLEPFDSAVEQAGAIKLHSAKYLSPLSDPLLGLVLLQHRYRQRFRYALGEAERRRDGTIRRIRFEETAAPTILRRDRDDLPTRGSAWIDDASGRVLRTEVEIGPVDRDRILLETSFRVDRTLGMDAPAIMTESWVRGVTTRVVGRAYYERFRRFSVRTTERIRQP
jgi:hypothetical protein